LNEYLESKISNLKTKISKTKACKQAEGKDERESFIALQAKSKNLEKLKSQVGLLLAREIQKDNKEFIEKDLKIKFDEWVSEEKDIYQENKIEEVFENLKKKKLVYQKEGAWWLKTSQFGEERDWPVIRKGGEPTYLLSDIAYHQDKISRGFSRNN